MSIARKAAHGVAWNMAFGISSRVLTLVATLLLTRFIDPDAYGDVLAASLSVATVGVLTSFAFGQYLIARDAAAPVAFQAAVLHVALGVVAMVGLYLLREPAGDLLDTPGLSRYVLGYAAAHVIERIRYVPERLLMRDLRFRAIATINGCGELVFVVVALALATSLGAWAVVAAFVVRAVFVTAAYLRTTPRAQWWAPTWPRRATARDLFGYGLPVMLGAVADRAATRWDSLVVSKLFGGGVMARYNLAYSLAEVPVSHVAEHIGEVLMPSFARMGDGERREAVVRAAALLQLIVWPLGVGLGAVAPTLVDAFFDERWTGIAPLLAILSVMTVFRPMTWSPMAYLQAIQQTRLVMIAAGTRALLVLPGVAGLGLAGGPTWACVGAALGYALHSVGTVIVTGRVTGLPVGRYLVGVFRPALACVPMVAAVWAIAGVLARAGASPLVALGCELVIGAVTYIGAAFVLVRPAATALIRIARDVLRGRR